MGDSCNPLPPSPRGFYAMGGSRGSVVLKHVLERKTRTQKQRKTKPHQPQSPPSKVLPSMPPPVELRWTTLRPLMETQFSFAGCPPWCLSLRCCGTVQVSLREIEASVSGGRRGVSRTAGPVPVPVGVGRHREDPQLVQHDEGVRGGGVLDESPASGR